jgi:diacylglycerol kinase (ATP)
MLQSQHNARLHVAATFLVCIFGAGFQISRAEWCFVILSMIAVWTAEAVNTAIECVTDLACPEFHSLAGKAKDVAAAAVLISAFGSAVIGAIVFAPYFYFTIIRLTSTAG